LILIGPFCLPKVVPAKAEFSGTIAGPPAPPFCDVEGCVDSAVWALLDGLAIAAGDSDALVGFCAEGERSRLIVVGCHTDLADGVEAAAGASVAISAGDGASVGRLWVTGEGAASELAAGAPRSASPAVTGVHTVGSDCGSSIGVDSGSGSSCANASVRCDTGRSPRATANAIAENFWTTPVINRALAGLGVNFFSNPG
jgi:hypothetical protein